MNDGWLYSIILQKLKRIFWLNWTEIQFKIIHGNKLNGSISAFRFCSNVYNFLISRGVCSEAQQNFGFGGIGF